MQNTLQKPLRNPSIECCKLLAAVFVVFIHEPFPQPLGGLATALARFAVPMFFCISGYFNFRADTRQIYRRMVHIGKLTAFSFSLCLAWGLCMSQITDFRDVWYFFNRGARALMELIFLQAPPYPVTGHLWYLLSLLLCYLVLWGYTCFRGEEESQYRPLYYAGFSLFAIYFTFSILLPLGGMSVPFRACRNGWLTGIPMFLMGIFLHEYQETILQRFRLSSPKLVGLFFLGIVLTLLDWKAGLSSEIPLGTMLEVPALLLLLVRHPQLPGRRSWFGQLASKFGTLSTAVYVLHLMVQDGYNRYLRIPAEGILGSKEPWLRPILLVMLSFLAAMVWERIEWLLKKAEKSRR